MQACADRMDARAAVLTGEEVKACQLLGEQRSKAKGKAMQPFAAARHCSCKGILTNWRNLKDRMPMLTNQEAPSGHDGYRAAG